RHYVEAPPSASRTCVASSARRVRRAGPGRLPLRGGRRRRARRRRGNPRADRRPAADRGRGAGRPAAGGAGDAAPRRRAGAGPGRGRPGGRLRPVRRRRRPGLGLPAAVRRDALPGRRIGAGAAHPAPGLGGRDALTVQCAVSAVLFTGLAGATGSLAPPADPGFWAAVAWVVLLSTFGGYGFYWAVLARTDVTRVSALLY